MSQPPSFDYKSSGVNIDEGDKLVKLIKPHCERTKIPGVLGGIGGFGALFELPQGQYQQPVLVSATDGVGTKLKLAHQLNQHDTIGIDLVAMCVNDLVISGAKPLFFLDYYATAALNAEQAAQVVKGIAEGCVQAGCALVGGETAEMPGMYQPGDYDLAGFAVGVVEKAKIISGQNIAPGDVLLGLASSGPHSNGYSLIRKLIEIAQIDLQESLEGKTFAAHVMEPTRIYVQSLLKLQEQIPIKAMAHITGGGITENLPRVFSKNLKAVIHKSNWSVPPIFSWLQHQGNIAETEMLRTFNCGIGMILCVAESDVEHATQILLNLGEQVFRLGNIEPRQTNEAAVVYL